MLKNLESSGLSDQTVTTTAAAAEGFVVGWQSIERMSVLRFIIKMPLIALGPPMTTITTDKINGRESSGVT